MQRETIVIRLRSYCLPLYLVGNHFERYYASSPRIAPAPFSSKNFSNENYSDRSFQNNIPTNIIDTIRHYHATYTHHFFFLLNIPNSQWSKFVATDGAQSYKITKANEQATNKKKKKRREKREGEREGERKQPITEKFLAKVFLKLQWNVGGHPRRKKFRAKTQKRDPATRTVWEPLSFTRCEAECTIMLKN